MNPLYPTGIVIPKGNFNEEHKGTIWFESDKAMDDFFRDLSRTQGSNNIIKEKKNGI
jgi:hypothetical protein